MLSKLMALGLGAVVNGLVVRDSCDIHVEVAGSISGPVGQISSGQIRAGEGISSAAFTLKGDEMWDSQGRGCWWTRTSHPPP